MFSCLPFLSFSRNSAPIYPLLYTEDAESLIIRGVLKLNLVQINTDRSYSVRINQTIYIEYPKSKITEKELLRLISIEIGLDPSQIAIINQVELISNSCFKQRALMPDDNSELDLEKLLNPEHFDFFSIQVPDLNLIPSKPTLGL